MRLRRTPGAAAVLVAAALFLRPGIASAQMMSKWGRPVFAIGWTGYDEVSTGHGNYPGSNGYIPGYGYYPGPFPSHYPWIDGPADHAHHGPPAADPEASVPPGAAVLRVRVPADALVWVGAYRTAQRGPYRVFVTPPLDEGRSLSYDLRARWVEDGRPVERVRTVPVYPGDRRTVDFLTPEAPETLGPPRRFNPP